MLLLSFANTYIVCNIIGGLPQFRFMAPGGHMLRFILPSLPYIPSFPPQQFYSSVTAVRSTTTHTQGKKSLS